jgi:hypothetical protein
MHRKPDTHEPIQPEELPTFVDDDEDDVAAEVERKVQRHMARLLRRAFSGAGLGWRPQAEPMEC